MPDHLRLITNTPTTDTTELAPEAPATDAEIHELLGRAMLHVLRAAFDERARLTAKLAAAESRAPQPGDFRL